MTEREWLTTDDVNVLLRAMSTWDHSRTVLAGLTQIPSDRKLLLLMAAWCREIFELLRDSRCKRAVRIAELFADGLANEADRASAGMGNVQVFSDSRRLDVKSREYARSQAIAWAIGGHSERLLGRAWQVSQWLADDIPSSRRADLLRHVVGNPFQEKTIYKIACCPLCMGEGGWLDTDGKVRKYQKCSRCESGLRPTVAILSPTVIDIASALSRGANPVAAGPLHDALLDCGAPQELVEHFAKKCQYCKDALGEPMKGYLGNRCICHGSRFQWHPKGCWAIDLLLGKE